MAKLVLILIKVVVFIHALMLRQGLFQIRRALIRFAQ